MCCTLIRRACTRDLRANAANRAENRLMSGRSEERAEGKGPLAQES
jgi:hypothetical protein